MFTKLFMEKEIKYFAFIATVIGIIMSFLVGPWQVPDENGHIYFIGQSINNPYFGEKIGQSLGIDRGRVEMNATEIINWSQYYAAMSKDATYSIKEMLPQGVNLSVLKYLPIVIGMQLGILLQLPTVWVLHLGEIVSLLVYVLICSIALKICPIKKGVLAMFMLSPMMMQAAGGITYDALLNAFIFLLIAYVFYLRYEKETIVLSDILILVGVWLWITYIKPPYIVLVLMGLMLPLKKFAINILGFEINEIVIKKIRWIALAIAIAGVVAVIYLLRDNIWIQLVLGLISNWQRTLLLVLNTFKTDLGTLTISSVGNFGWLRAPVSKWVAVGFYGFIFMMSVIGDDDSKKQIKKWDRGIMSLTFIALTLMVMFPLAHHTIMIILYGTESIANTYDVNSALYQINYIGGLQGRYFVPFLPLLFLQCGSLQLLDKKKTKIIWSIFGLVLYAYVSYILINRFWI